jgi:hypothetical protein
VATWEDVDRVALALPEVVAESGGNRTWKVRAHSLAWERPLRKADLAHLGDSAPRGDVLGIRVADEGVKHALIADDPSAFFTTPHFDGYPAVLAVLEALDVDVLQELLTDMWLARAPKRVVKEWQAAR